MTRQLISHRLATAGVAMLMVILLVGCSVVDEEPSESLTLCGEHSCGDLRMVTSDTSSDGFQYLEPTLSPDGTQLAFTADFNALPEPGHGSDDDFALHRMLITMEMPEEIPVADYLNSVQPQQDLASQGAHLMLFRSDLFIWKDGRQISLDGNEETKSSPNWIDDDTILFSMSTTLGGEGNRLFIAELPPAVDGEIVREVLDAQVFYQEPDDYVLGGLYWQHISPSVSPDGQWVAFSRHGCENNMDSQTCTKQTLCVVNLVENTDQLITLTEGASELAGASWSSDSSRIAFHAGRDLSGESGYGTEIYTIDFDTTGLAATGAVELNRDLRRATYTYETFGNPIDNVRNLEPFFGPGDDNLVYTSTQRAPSLTIRVRNLWQVPVDGNLEPSMFFFSRDDDMCSEPAGDGRRVVFSSWMGFPEEALNILEAKARARIAAEDIDNQLTEAEEAEMAAEERDLLARFSGTMAHLYVFTTN